MKIKIQLPAYRVSFLAKQAATHIFRIMGAKITLVVYFAHNNLIPYVIMVIMTYQELVQTIQSLPLTERLALLEVLAQSLQADMQSETVLPSSLARVRGMLKPDGPVPSDQELKEAYTDHLIEKYA